MNNPSALSALAAVIADRKANPPAEGSYVAKLIHGGASRIVGKMAEETAEVIDAAREPGKEGREHLVREAADLVFHTLVLLGSFDIPFADVEAELSRRFGISGIVEKASRGKNETDT